MSSQEHWNYFGIDESLGPVAVSLRREKLEEDKEHGQQYNYRLIFRTSEVSLAWNSFAPAEPVGATFGRVAMASCCARTLLAGSVIELVALLSTVAAG